MSTPHTTTPAVRRLMVACCVVLALHVLAALCFTILPNSYLHQRRVSLWYRQYMLAGPFYRDDQLGVSYHARVRYHTPRQSWSPERDYAEDLFHLYHDRPWRYDALKQSDYAQGLVRAAYGEYLRDTTRAVLLEKPAWRTLQAYVAEQLLPAQPIDSVNIRYYGADGTRQPGKRISVKFMDVTYTPQQHAAP
jgi:hypothetical protein